MLFFKLNSGHCMIHTTIVMYQGEDFLDEKSSWPYPMKIETDDIPIVHTEKPLKCDVLAVHDRVTFV